MLSPDLDRYYTPSDVARSVIEASDLSNPSRCLDSTCGDGSLLEEAHRIIPRIRCYGIDTDHQTIAKLRAKHPDWVLSQGDALAPTTWQRTRASRESTGCDLALLNPPFSMQAKKGVIIQAPGFEVRCSVAMAHIIVVAARAKPRVCTVIVPESLLYSNLDAIARNWLQAFYSWNVAKELVNTTFLGARANAIIITLRRKQKPTPVLELVEFPARQPIAGIVRGGLPIFQAIPDQKGITLVHSTDIENLIDGFCENMTVVRPIGRGIVSGYTILLPRVGIPRQEQVRAVHIPENIQLSDCVIALTFKSKGRAVQAERMLHAAWAELIALYRGTGARYITLQRLTEWLRSRSIIPK